MSQDKSKSDTPNANPLDWLDDSPEPAVATDSEAQKIAENAAQASFTLPASLTVQHIEGVYEDLNAFTQQGDNTQPLVLDGEQIASLDSSGYQLLVSAIKHCETEQRQWELVNPSDALVEKLKRLGDKVVLGSS